MHTTEIDTHCQINAPESSSWNVFRTEGPKGNSTAAPVWHHPVKWLWILPVIATVAAILLATGCFANTRFHNTQPVYDQRIHTVVIEGNRMSTEQKRDFDLNTALEQLAQAEIADRNAGAQP